jgi:hypothetical protein
MFAAKWTREAAANYDAIKHAALAARKATAASPKEKEKGGGKSPKAVGLFKQVTKCLNNLLNDPKHPGLATHEYHSLPHPYDPKGKVYEAYVQNRTPGAYRLFWCYGPGKREVTIIAIAPHP